MGFPQLMVANGVDGVDGAFPGEAHWCRLCEEPQGAQQALLRDPHSLHCLRCLPRRQAAGGLGQSSPESAS